MDQRANRIFFALIRSAIRGTALNDEEKALYSVEILPEIGSMASKHDLLHLVSYALKKNSLPYGDYKSIDKSIVSAAYRYEKISYETKRLSRLLSSAEIPFVLLKGSVLRDYYPEPWMRTSCDIDILVRNDDVDRTVGCLTENGKYTVGGRTAHDISTFSPNKTHVEVHFNLLEEGTANEANDLLDTVWDNVSLRGGDGCLYDMTDEFFYLYHIAHMARHFEVGGCGVRTFVDLWILDNIPSFDKEKRDRMLDKAGLLKFAEISRELSRAWLEDIEPSEIPRRMESFILSGGAFGTVSNRVALNQSKKGGRIGYIFSRIFVPYERLVRYYPVLKKHRWLMPFMQVRRWFMIFRPRVSQMVKAELEVNLSVEKDRANEMNRFLCDVGLGSAKK